MIDLGKFEEIFRSICVVTKEFQEFLLSNKTLKLLDGLTLNLLAEQIVDPSKKTPQMICKHCIHDLNAADRLRLQIIDAEEYINALIESAEAAMKRVKPIKIEISSEDDEPVKNFSYDKDQEDYDQTIPSDRIPKLPIDKEIITKPVMLQPKVMKVKSIKEPTKLSPIIVKADEPPTKFVEKPKEKSPLLTPKTNKAQRRSEPKAEESEPESSPTTRGSKRNRKLSNKLLESSEPAAKRIKRMHAMTESPTELKNVEKPKLKISPKEVKASKVESNVSKKTAFVCDTCNASFLTYPELMKHLDTHAGKALRESPSMVPTNFLFIFNHPQLTTSTFASSARRSSTSTPAVSCTCRKLTPRASATCTRSKTPTASIQLRR